MSSLQHCGTENAVLEALNQLPVDLMETYTQAMRKTARSQHARDAQLLLLWLTFAFCPLTQKQINSILEINLEDQHCKKNTQMSPKLDVIIDSNLVVLGLNGIVQLAHSSVKEFLITYCTNTHTTGLLEINETLAHDKLAQSCIIYLLSLKDEDLSDGTWDFPLAWYSAHYWPDHAKFVEELGVESPLSDLTKKILKEDSLQFRCWLNVYQRFGGEIKAAHLLCSM